MVAKDESWREGTRCFPEYYKSTVTKKNGTGMKTEIQTREVKQRARKE